MCVAGSRGTSREEGDIRVEALEREWSALLNAATRSQHMKPGTWLLETLGLQLE